jgi:hypothetical protein
MPIRWDHCERQGYVQPCGIFCIYTLTVPFDDDAMENQLPVPGATCSVQVTPVSVDLQIDP